MFPTHQLTKTLTAVLVAASLTSAQEEPLGTIVAWHKNLPGTPTLPAGWEECGGQVVADATSPYDGQALPDLNNTGRFLRGGNSSGTFQLDAFQGHHHSVDHDAERIVAWPTIWGGGGIPIADDYAGNVTILDPISDGVNGDPRTADETRPDNMSAVFVLKTNTAKLPIGSMLAWHPDFANTPNLPSAWARCDGQLVTDIDSPYLGQTLPDLNGDARFLRGAPVSGTLQEDAFQGHRHDANHNAEGLIGGGPIGTGGGGQLDEVTARVDVLDPISDGVNGAPRTADETRPVNMSVVWVIKIKDGSTPVGSILPWHRDFPNTPAAADRVLPCDGSTIADLMSPYDGQTLPDLNGEGRFLRGGGVSGVLQDDAFQGHHHAVSHTVEHVKGGAAYGFGPGLDIVDDPNAFIEARDPIGDGVNGTPRTAVETRPTNMSVVFVMTVKGPWDDLANALAGTTGEPVLIGTGPLVEGEPFALELSNAFVSGVANLFYGFSTAFAPLKGGVLVPSPDFIVFGLPMFGGELLLTSVWPAGIPAGVTIHWQYWISDPGGPFGFSASNGVRCTSQDL